MNKELNNILKILKNAKIHANIAVKNKSLCQARIKIWIGYNKLDSFLKVM
jgi:hypothetical protein